MGSSAGLSTNAFRSLPDPALLYLSDQHARALAFVELSLRHPGCLCTLVAEPSCGKTIVISAALAALPRPIEVLQVDGTGLGEKELMSQLVTQLRAGDSRQSVLPGLPTIRSALASRGDQVVLIVDNAHRVEVDVFEAINAMARADDDVPRLSVVLTGEPGLEVLIHTLDRQLLEQWTVLMAHIPPLNLRDVRQYILLRVRHDGVTSPESAFGEETYPLLHSFSEGIPGKLNTLCDESVKLARESGDNRIDVAHVRAAMARLNWSSKGQPGDLSLVHSDAVACLSIARDEQTLRVYPLYEERTMIGRGEDNEIVIDAPYVSRHHALIVRDERGFWLFDMNSTNGTLVNGQRVLQRQYLYPGDQVRIGRHVMTFSGPRQARSGAAADLHQDRPHGRTAIGFNASGDLDAELSRLDQLIEENPGHAELLFQRACLLWDIDRTEDAIEQFEQLLGSGDESAEARNNLAVLYANKGELLRARNELERALELRPDYPQARENLGNVLLHLALEQFDQAIISPADPESCQIKRLAISRLLGS